MHSSRTPSPTKSPRRQALASRDSNIRQQSNSPMLKPLNNISSPQLSARHVSRTKTASRTPSPQKVPSPLKRTSKLFTQPPPQLGFKIFEDPTDYSTEICLSSRLAISEENDFSNAKENIAPKSPLRSQGGQRTVLGDLGIYEHAGFITYYPKDSATLADPKRGVYQLDTLWNAEGLVNIPSYVTPPRKNRMKYISFTQDKVKLKRSNSGSDLRDKAVKKLVFDIHRD